MKIKISSDIALTDSQKQIVALLELDEEFEKLIWLARGLLGIKPEDLEVKATISQKNKGLYQEAWGKRPKLPTYSTIKSYINELANIGDALNEKLNQPIQTVKSAEVDKVAEVTEKLLKNKLRLESIDKNELRY